MRDSGLSSDFSNQDAWILPDVLSNELPVLLDYDGTLSAVSRMVASMAKFLKPSDYPSDDELIEAEHL